jgi:glutamyl-tRNA synthetase
MPNDAEKFTLSEMVENFSIERVSLGGPIFDIEKLRWLNGRWLREDLSDDDFVERVSEWAINRAYMKQLVPLLRPRVETFADLAPIAQHFFIAEPNLSAAAFAHKKLSELDCKRVLQLMSWRFDTLVDWTPEALRAIVEAVAAALQLKLRDAVFPLFVAISGQSSSTPIFETLAILRQELVRVRLRKAIAVLGGFTTTEAEDLAKAHAPSDGKDKATAAEP